ncbi:MAG: radical SAM family heme chaperone HemW [Puniceicoccales bacterium]|nr:radical SAM family heme chaperone HemW [Puniceicoccales bacterium]
MQRATGLYCHVPFCANRCAYCAFYQEPPTSALIARYLVGIGKERSLLGVECKFDTIYVGGGTPGLLAPRDMESLCRTLTSKTNGTMPLEFSVEFSPMAVRAEKIEVLKNYGCNRVTMGVQSFSEKTMRVLGRRQVNRLVFAAYETILAHGIDNIGIDLIFGVPGQTIGEWLGDLKCAVDMRPRHISTYNLTLEDGTPLKQNLPPGLAKKSNDEEADFYMRTWDFLESNGYEQYEISNFCLPGFGSIHNSNTWKMQDWIGIGPSACSQWLGRRFSNPPSISKWLTDIESGTLAHTNVECVDEKTMAEDCVIFGLRMTQGIDVRALKNRFGTIDFTGLDALFLQLENDGFLRTSDHWAKLTPKGRLVADAIAIDVLGTLHSRFH